MRKQPIADGDIRLNQPFRVLNEDEILLGIGEITEIETINRLISKVVLV